MSFNQQMLKYIKVLATDVADIESAETSNPLVDTVQTLGTDEYVQTTTKGIAIAGVRNNEGTTILIDDENKMGPISVDDKGAVLCNLITTTKATSGASASVYTEGDKTLIVGGTRNEAQLSYASDDNYYTPFATDQHGNTLTDSMKIRGTAISVGSGVNGTGVQRMTLATNDQLMSGIAAQGDTGLSYCNIADIIWVLSLVEQAATNIDASITDVSGSNFTSLFGSIKEHLRTISSVRNDNASSTVGTANGAWAPFSVTSNGEIHTNLQKVANTAITAGTGTVGAGTIRATIATDDNVSTKLTTISTTLTNIYTILNDVWDSTNHKLNVNTA